MDLPVDEEVGCDHEHRQSPDVLTLAQLGHIDFPQHFEIKITNSIMDQHFKRIILIILLLIIGKQSLSQLPFSLLESQTDILPHQRCHNCPYSMDYGPAPIQLIESLICRAKQEMYCDYGSHKVQYFAALHNYIHLSYICCLPTPQLLSCW
jgi:hypothetical protein